jgi:hypothetical protein
MMYVILELELFLRNAGLTAEMLACNASKGCVVAPDLLSEVALLANIFLRWHLAL